MLKICGEKGEILCSVSSSPDQTLLEILQENGIFVDAPCGGNGTCGKCRVSVDGMLSPLSEEELIRLSPAEREKGIRLACRTRVLGDAVLTLSDRSAFSVETEGKGENVSFCPSVSVGTFLVPDGNLETQTDDMSRTLSATGLKTASLTALRHLPMLLRKENGTVRAVSDGDRLLDVVLPEQRILGLAVDIGTTTVAAYLFDLQSGQKLTVRSALNPQRSFGSDVISRIAACAEQEGLENQRRLMTGLLSRLAGEMARENGAESSSIFHAVIAANTTMLHLLAGLDPAGIASAPFLAADLFGKTFTACELGLSFCPDARVDLLPCVSSYVGADIVAGIAACGLDACNKRVIYLDIGTNGEMGYLGDGKALLCSTAAGPAFEGASISCGMGGVPGAVSSLMETENGFSWETIGNLAPAGFCGSGLIDAVAALLRIEAVDATGRMVDEDELDAPWNQFLNEKGEFVFNPETGLRLTPQDIREVQLAKAAICAGIRTLLEKAERTCDDLDELVVAGGFGAHIRPESACAIGLLPPELLGKIRMAGNAAGLGAGMYLLDRTTEDRIKAFLSRCEYLELSGSREFQDCYIEEMMFGEI